MFILLMLMHASISLLINTTQYNYKHACKKKNLSYLDEDNSLQNRYVHVCIIHIGIIHAGKSVTKIVTLQYTEVTDA